MFSHQAVYPKAKVSLNGNCRNWQKQMSIGLDFLLASGSLEWFASLHYQKVASRHFSVWHKHQHLDCILQCRISGFHIHGNNLQMKTDLKDIASNVKTQVSDPKPPAVHKDGTQDCSGLFFSIGMTYRQTINVYSWPICTMRKYHLLWWCQSQH